MTDYETLTKRIKLIAHPERLRILDALRREPECVCHLEVLLGKPQPYVSQQLRVLRDAGVIADERRGQNIYYRLVDVDMDAWLGQILGTAVGGHPDLVRHKRVISCECPTCEAGVEITFDYQQGKAEVHVNKKKALFLCRRNSARSQMAEGFLRHYAADHFEVHSAGFEAAEVDPDAVKVMSEKGISLERQHSKDLREYLGHMHFGYLFTVCDHAEENCPRTFLSVNEHIYWPFEDPAKFEGPAEARVDKFREVRDEIDTHIQGWLADHGIMVAA